LPDPPNETSKSFDYFQSQFENVGKNLTKAQEAFETAQKHLKTYRGRVTVLSGQEQLDLDAAAAKNEEPPLPLTDKASA
jgi:DNA anti-recombination protein RmuC